MSQMCISGSRYCAVSVSIVLCIFHVLSAPLQNAQTSPGSRWACYSMGQRRLGLKHTTHFFLVSRSWIIGCLHLLPLCAFLVCTGAALPYLPLKQHDSLLFSRFLFKWEQDRQYIFNVTSRRIRNIVLHILSVPVALVIQNAKLRRHIFIFGLFCCSIFLHIISHTVL